MSFLNLPLLTMLEYHILGLLTSSRFWSRTILTCPSPLKESNQILFFLILFAFYFYLAAEFPGNRHWRGDWKHSLCSGNILVVLTFWGEQILSVFRVSLSPIEDHLESEISWGNLMVFLPITERHWPLPVSLGNELLFWSSYKNPGFWEVPLPVVFWKGLLLVRSDQSWFLKSCGWNANDNMLWIGFLH